MVSIKLLAFSALCAAAAINQRDASLVLAGLHRINNDTVFLGTANQGYNGSATSALPVVAGVTALQTDLSATAKTAGASPVFTEADAQGITDYFKRPLNPNTAFTVGTLKANREKIRQGGFYGTVQTQLAGLKSAVDELVKNVEADTPKTKYAAAKQALDEFQGYYADAVKYFS